MKNFLLYCITFLASANTAICQTEFAPTGASWTFTLKTYWTNFDGYMALQYQKDTTIGDFSCKKLHASILDFSQNEVDKHDFYFSQSNDSVFMVYAPDQRLFGFKTKYVLGESTKFSYLWPETLTVNAIEQLDFGGQPIEKYTFNSSEWPSGQIIVYEKFGPVLGFFENWWGTAVDGNSYKLLCYHDSEIQLAQINDGPCIIPISATNASVQEEGLSVFPNPAFDKIVFDFQNSSYLESMNIAIWDVSGRVHVETVLPANQQLDISFLTSGIYFGSLLSHEKNVPFKFVKQ
jgi:Secretion system C-terminal sorting domain